MIVHPGYKYTVGVHDDDIRECIAWLLANLEDMTWAAQPHYYLFCFKEDAILFKLRFGGYDTRRI